MQNREFKFIWSMDSNQPSWQIIKDWEDELSVRLNLQIRKETRWSRYIKFRAESCGLGALYNSFVTKKDFGLRFIMTARPYKSIFVTPNTIPVVIDFWLEEKDLPGFYECYKECPVVLISSMDVFTFLKENKCPLPIEHWPLSYPDKYGLKNNFYKKKYDFCLLGRPNPFFIRLLDEYSDKHPQFSYVKSIGTSDNREYITNKGDYIGKDTGRSSYISMIQSTKISCYSTPGIDEAKSLTKRFNQVTPRLFEMLCNGCMVIGHYPETPDVKWYELDKYIPNVNSYEEFEAVLDKLLDSSFNYDLIHEFVSKHYTSTRAEMLKGILQKYNIRICD